MNGQPGNLFGSRSVIKILKLITVFLVLISFTSSVEAGKKKENEKDCIYCKKYETMEDWPESERPAAFIYEEVNYPEGMFHKNN